MCGKANSASGRLKGDGGGDGDGFNDWMVVIMQDIWISPSSVPSRTRCMGKLMAPLVDSKETSGAKTESAAGRSRSRNNL